MQIPTQTQTPSALKCSSAKNLIGSVVVDFSVWHCLSGTKSSQSHWNPKCLLGILKKWKTRSVKIHSGFMKFGWAKENKRPKGPHNVHLSTMCYLFDGSARVAIFVYWSAKKNARKKRSCFPSTFVEFRTVVSEEKSNNLSQWETLAAIFFLISPKNTN